MRFLTPDVGRVAVVLALLATLRCAGERNDSEDSPDAASGAGGATNGGQTFDAGDGSDASGGIGGAVGGMGGCRWGGGNSGCPPPDHCGDIGQPCCESYRAVYAGCYKGGICWDGVCRPDGKPCSDSAECFTGTCELMPDGEHRCTGPCTPIGCIEGWACLTVEDAGISRCGCGPTHVESCNGKDDDCNGSIDDGC